MRTAMMARTRGAIVSPAGPNDPVEIIRSIYPGLLRAARSLVGDQDAADLVQDVLVEMLTRRPRFEGIEYPVGYARVVLFRLSYSWLGRKRKEEPSEDVQLKLGAQEADWTIRVDSAVEIERALQGLGTRQRACFTLRHLYGLTDRETAAILGCRRSTVRSQSSRAMAAVRSALGVAVLEEDDAEQSPWEMNGVSQHDR